MTVLSTPMLAEAPREDGPESGFRPPPRSPGSVVVPERFEQIYFRARSAVLDITHLAPITQPAMMAGESFSAALAVEPRAGWLTRSDGVSLVTVGLMPQIGPGRAGSPPPRAELRENRRV